MTYTWKVVYYPVILDGGRRGVALVEGATQQDALYAFHQEYKGQYSTVASCTKL